MISLETVEYWSSVLVEWERTYYDHRVPSFEKWVTETYNCRISFNEFEISAAFVFDREIDAMMFLLKYQQ